MPLDPDLLELLTHTAVVERYTGEDKWGNNTYAAPITIPVFTVEDNLSFAQEDTQNRQRVGPSTGYRLITDAIDLKPGDKITFAGDVTYVTGAQTVWDETEPLMQNVDVATEEEV